MFDIMGERKYWFFSIHLNETNSERHILFSHDLLPHPLWHSTTMHAHQYRHWSWFLLSGTVQSNIQTKGREEERREFLKFSNSFTSLVWERESIPVGSVLFTHYIMSVWLYQSRRQYVQVTNEQTVFHSCRQNIGLSDNGKDAERRILLYFPIIR